MALPKWLARGLGRPVKVAPTPAGDGGKGAVSFAAALLQLGFDSDAYRRHVPALAPLSDADLAAHYDVSGRVERYPIRFGVELTEGHRRIDAMGLPDDARTLLRHDLAAAALRATDVFGRDLAELQALLRPSPAYRPLVVIGDSHAMLYLSEDVLRSASLLPVPFLCTGASARGLGNPASRGRAGERIAARLVELEGDLGAAAILLKFGQVDLEFVHDYRRIRDGGRPFDLAEATAFAEESVRRYVDFLAGLARRTRAPLVVTAALPPALSDEALRAGYLNAHIAELHANLDVEALRQALQALDMPDWKTRTQLAAVFNRTLAVACDAAGLIFYDDFTPLVGDDGVIDPALIAWHGGTDHHLCFTIPAARRDVGAFAADIARLTAPT